MHPQRLMLSAVTRTNRHDAMAGINDAVLAAGGWIEGHTLFSNIATTFRIELPEARIPGLAGALEALGILLDTESRDRLAAPGSPSARAAERALSLNVTFIHNEPELRRDVPMVPG